MVIVVMSSITLYRPLVQGAIRKWIQVRLIYLQGHKLVGTLLPTSSMYSNGMQIRQLKPPTLNSNTSINSPLPACNSEVETTKWTTTSPAGKWCSWRRTSNPHLLASQLVVFHNLIRWWWVWWMRQSAQIQAKTTKATVELNNSNNNRLKPKSK